MDGKKEGGKKNKMRGEGERERTERGDRMRGSEQEERGERGTEGEKWVGRWVS